MSERYIVVDGERRPGHALERRESAAMVVAPRRARRARLRITTIDFEAFLLAVLMGELGRAFRRPSPCDDAACLLCHPTHSRVEDYN